MKSSVLWLLPISALVWANPNQGSDQATLKKQNAKPNIVIVLTDDQDLHMDSVNYMPRLKRHVINHGTFYKRHFCSTAICCPSRATLWTGRNAHNTNVTDVFPPYGGYSKFVSQGWNSNWLPLWLQDAGYNTYYTGKLFNDHDVNNWNSPHPSGFNGSDFLLDPHTYDYLNATFQRNDQPPRSYEGEYSTDILAEKAYGFLEEGISAESPFFLAVAPVAPHSNVRLEQLNFDDPDILDKVHMTPPIPAERHKDLFPNVKVPRKGNFNPEKASGAGWVKQLARLNDTVVSYNDNFYRRRLQALQAVDEIVEGLIERLTKAGILDNTYFFYTTDNGYHISQHRLNPGKECGFEEDINIPLIVRGPGVQVGKEENELVTAHTDLAPTFLEIATGKIGKGNGWEGLDGSPIPFVEAKKRELGRQEHVNVEFWGRGIPEGAYKLSLDDGRYVFYGANNTYKALRLVGKNYNLYYSVWCTNEHELYDLTTDPYQINNIYPTHPLSPEHSILSLPLSKVLPRLDALLLVTKSCKAHTCTDPWSVIHPKGDVKTLADALNRKYDAFYHSLTVQRKVGFTKCELGYVRESEGAQELGVVFEEGVRYGEEEEKEEL